VSLKENIVHESLKLFSLKGFQNTGVNEILEAAHTSKGGFYNYFASKEELFHAVLAEAQGIWRARVLGGIREIESPVQKIKIILGNYKDNYLKDSDNFPGGCIFITLSVELKKQRPHLAKEINKGLNGFRRLLKNILEEGKEKGELKGSINSDTVVEILLGGMLGASVLYGVDQSDESLDRSIGALSEFLDLLIS
jgi:AcrR family transcriptional regulator